MMPPIVLRDAFLHGQGSCIVVPLTPGGGVLSDVKLKKQDQVLTLGSKVGLLRKAAVFRGGLG
jgi:hypothetical protein